MTAEDIAFMSTLTRSTLGNRLDWLQNVIDRYAAHEADERQIIVAALDAAYEFGRLKEVIPIPTPATPTEPRS